MPKNNESPEFYSDESYPDSWQTLPPGFKFLLSVLSSSHRPKLSFEEADAYARNFRTPEATLNKTASIISQLESFAKSPDQHQDPELQTAWRVLSNFAQLIAPTVRLHHGCLFVYGSLIYGDPVNLDYDLILITPQDAASQALRPIVYRWQEQLNQQWLKIGEMGNFTNLSIETLQEHIKGIETDDPEYISRLYEHIEVDFWNASTALTGLPLIAPDSSNWQQALKSRYVAGTKSQINKLYREHPAMAAIMLPNLESCLEIRKTRRL